MSRPMRLPGPLLAVVLAATLAACESSPRRLADGSMMGRMTTTQQLPMVAIDGKPHRLAPGARIVGPNNTTLTSNQLPADAQVRYRLDGNGQVSHVWVVPAGR